MDGGLTNIILFAMIAAFLVFRLKNVLGRRDGHEGNYHDPFKADPEQDADRDTDADADENVIALPDRGKPDGAKTAPQADLDDELPELDKSIDPDGSLRPGLVRIHQNDPNFDPQEFVVGARVAFDMVVNAFAAGDEATLKSLLSPDVFNDFRDAIKARRDAGQILEDTLVGIRSADITEADMDGPRAMVTVKFVSDQINVLLGADGEVIDGDPSAVITVVDYWTFSREARSRDPNWTLVATDSPE